MAGQAPMLLDAYQFQETLAVPMLKAMEFSTARLFVEEGSEFRQWKLACKCARQPTAFS